MIASRQSRHGFTLIELLVAMSLGMMVVLSAIFLLGRTRDDSARIGDAIHVEREARAVLTQLTADLHGARFDKDSVLEPSRSPWPCERLGFLSLQAPDAQSAVGRIGDLCAIHYYLRDILINGKTVRCLMRGIRESNDTFKALRENQSASLFTGTERDEPIAFGILSFTAHPQACDASGHWRDWDPGSVQPPAALAVRLVVVRREIVGKLTTSAAWDGSGATAKLLGAASHANTNRHLEVYATFIRCAPSSLTEREL